MAKKTNNKKAKKLGLQEASDADAKKVDVAELASGDDKKEATEETPASDNKESDPPQNAVSFDLPSDVVKKEELDGAKKPKGSNKKAKKRVLQEASAAEANKVDDAELPSGDDKKEATEETPANDKNEAVSVDLPRAVVKKEEQNGAKKSKTINKKAKKLGVQEASDADVKKVDVAELVSSDDKKEATEETPADDKNEAVSFDLPRAVVKKEEQNGAKKSKTMNKKAKKLGVQEASDADVKKVDVAELVASDDKKEATEDEKAVSFDLPSAVVKKEEMNGAKKPKASNKKAKKRGDAGTSASQVNNIDAIGEAAADGKKEADEPQNAGSFGLPTDAVKKDNNQEASSSRKKKSPVAEEEAPKKKVAKKQVDVPMRITRSQTAAMRANEKAQKN
ncbi:hypothetical protein QR680_016410 [Steinernema hermaphroditum]|uniref:Uncharacterized protein n=1 Tax=Steinernema hermaphroditum TaxID=289476 RepID=A0AA39LMA7_9BILA|nr:hypothetical protein QR680_016410 [Steinernema hermaphroditum]